MKHLIATAFFSVTFLAACAQESPVEFAQYNGERLQIEAVAKPGLIDEEVKLLINGETVIKQRSQAFGGSSQTFEGVWRGKRVTARATRVQNFMSAYTMVDVFIAGEHVETLVI